LPQTERAFDRNWSNKRKNWEDPNDAVEGPATGVLSITIRKGRVLGNAPAASESRHSKKMLLLTALSATSRCQYQWNSGVLDSEAFSP
jgi:hypothetical protein